MDRIKKMKIAMLGHKRIPSREGGVEIVVEELSTRMVKLGHQVTCFNRRGHHVSGKEFDGTNYHEYKGVKIKNVITINGKGLAAISSSFFAALAAAFGKTISLSNYSCGEGNESVSLNTCLSPLSPACLQVSKDSLHCFSQRRLFLSHRRSI